LAGQVANRIYTSDPGSSLANDVPFLWVDHPTLEANLPGMWESFEGSSGGTQKRKTTWMKQEITMLWTIFVVLLILWLLGFSLHVAGGLIHLLLVVALVVLVINLLSGRRSAV
jgi:Family of unknown function (DUF5670)